MGLVPWTDIFLQRGFCFFRENIRFKNTYLKNVQSVLSSSAVQWAVCGMFEVVTEMSWFDRKMCHFFGHNSDNLSLKNLSNLRYIRKITFSEHCWWKLRNLLTEIAAAWILEKEIAFNVPLHLLHKISTLMYFNPESGSYSDKILSGKTEPCNFAVFLVQ
jgi:hypothetical protein